MEVVLKTGAVKHAKLQSNRNHTDKPTPNFRLNAFPVAQPTVSEVRALFRKWVSERVDS